MGVYADQTYGTPYFWEQNVGKAPQSTLWSRFPLQAALTDAHTYVIARDDFAQCTIGSNTIPGFTFTSVTSGAITQDTTNPNGVLLMDTGASTANQGINFQANVSAFKIAAGKPVAFEAVLQVTGLSTTPKIQFFCGLAAASTAIIASGAFATLDRVGFQGITTTGIITSVSRGGGTAVTSTGFTLADSTVVRLGFYATSSQVDFYVNGILAGTSATSQIPTGALAVSFSAKANATVQPVLCLDSYICAGYRN